jgi:adenylate cyclase
MKTQLSFIENFCGDPEQGLVLGERARALNPLDPAFFIYLLAGSFSHLFCGRPAQALEFAQRSIALYADWDSTYWTLITSYVQLGRLDEARGALPKPRSLTPGLTISLLRRSLPYRNPATVDMILNAMSAAGLPE